MHKVIAVAAAVLLAASLAVAGASASSNKADGTIVSEVNASNIAFGGVLTCTSSSWSGPMTNNAAGAGITQSVTSVSFSGCGTGNTWTACNLPWSSTTTSSADGSLWMDSIQNVCLDISIFGALAVCRYQGSWNGGNYSEATDLLTLSGAITKTAGSALCPTSGSISGTYAVSPTDLDLS